MGAEPLFARTWLAARRLNGSVGYQQIANFGGRILLDASSQVSSGDSLDKELDAADRRP